LPKTYYLTKKGRLQTQACNVLHSFGNSGCLISFHLIVALLPFVAILVFVSCASYQIQPPHERTLTVTATAYNSLRNQTLGNPNIGAWGDPINPGMKTIAVSPDLLPLGLERGTKVRIQGLQGEYVVLDRMPSSWKKRIDIYMGTDVKAARSWGKRKVKIYWTITNEANP
jgi:3D (Asp-Asp-Asp) domain-containing protein